MKSKVLFFALTFSMILCLPLTSLAQSSDRPIQISLFHPVQIHDKDVSITGVRFNLIYGVNQDVYGLDCGFIVNKLEGDLTGLQNGMVNIVEGEVNGYQEGLVNFVKGDFTGWQTGFVNITRGQVVGLNTGFCNFNGGMTGIQFGLVNITETLNGLQIGLVNINHSVDPFKFLPIVNWMI